MKERSRQAAVAALYARPGHLLWRAHARVGVLVSRLPEGLGVHTHAALLALGECEPASQHRIARLVNVSPTSMTTVADELEHGGLVTRVRDPADRRCYALARTRAGRHAVRRWAADIDALDDDLTMALSQRQRDRLCALLHEVVRGDLDELTPSALVARPTFLVTGAHQRMHRHFLDALRPLGMEPRHYGGLRALREAGPVTQGDLASLLEVSPATVVEVVDHLQDLGVVERRRNPEDRRSYLVHVLDPARRVLTAATRTARRVEREQVGALGEAGHQDLVALLRRVVAGS